MSPHAVWLRIEEVSQLYDLWVNFLSKAKILGPADPLGQARQVGSTSTEDNPTE